MSGVAQQLEALQEEEHMQTGAAIKRPSDSASRDASHLAFRLRVETMVADLGGIRHDGPIGSGRRIKYEVADLNRSNLRGS